MTDKEIAYYVMSFTVEDREGRRSFQWPILPDPSMGKRFIKKIEKQRKEVSEWMKENPIALRYAELGIYLKPKNG